MNIIPYRICVLLALIDRMVHLALVSDIILEFCLNVNVCQAQSLYHLMTNHVPIRPPVSHSLTLHT